MNNRAAEYRSLIDDVVDGGLLDEDEWQQLKDVLARVEQKLRAKFGDQATPATEETVP